MDFAKLLPAFMAEQVDDIALADAIGPLLDARSNRVEQMRIWGQTDGMDDAVMDAIASALHISWWKLDWDVDTKREMLAKAEEIRLGTGTKWSLEFVLQRWFSDPELRVEEWWEYGGSRYTFRIITANTNVQKMLQFSGIIETLKRTSQSMDGIFLGFSMRGRAHAGAIGSEGHTDYGSVLVWPYLPKDSTYTSGDALEDFLWRSAGLSADDVRTQWVPEFTDGHGRITKDAPLIDGQPISSATRRAFRDAVQNDWIRLGSSVDKPSLSLVWPISGGGDLADGCIGYWSFEMDELSGVVDLTNAVDGSTGVLTGVAPASVGGLNGHAIGGVRAASGTRTDCRIRLLQMPDTDSWTVSRWGYLDSGFYRPTLFSTTDDMKGTLKPTWGRYDASHYNLNFDGTYRFDGTAITTGWGHVVVTRSGPTTSLYINGFLQDQQELPAFNIGGRYFGVDFLASTYNQVLDEVGVWNRALSAEEVAELYSKGRDGVSYPFR